MVALVAGNGLGLIDTSAFQTRGAGIIGDANVGHAGAGALAYVNISTGNLILQSDDESLSGTGEDLHHLRTYNAFGGSDGDNDRWRWLGEKKLVMTGNTVIRTTGDGHESTYTQTSSTTYVSSDGSGANDTITISGNKWTWTEGSSGVIESYDANTGWIQYRQDTSGNRINYTFDNGLLVKVTDASSEQTYEMEYENGRLSYLSVGMASSAGVEPTALERTVKYNHDSVGRLTSVETWLDSTGDNRYFTRYGYENTSSMRITSITQGDSSALAKSVGFTYDSTGRIQTVTDQGGTKTFAYGTQSDGTQYTTVENAEGDTWRYEYNSNTLNLERVISSLVDGESQTLSYEYDDQDNVIGVDDGIGGSVTFDYDDNSNLTREVDALGNTITREYTQDNLLSSETHYTNASLSSPTGAETTYFVYDNLKRLRFVIDGEGGVKETVYTAQGLVYLQKNFITAVYSASNKSITALESWVNAQNGAETEITYFSYDYRGNVTSEWRNANSSDSGWLTSGNYNEVTKYVYDGYGQLTQTISTNGTDHELASYVYDGMGRITFSDTGSGATETEYYEGSSKSFYSISTNAATGLETVTTFDSSGRVTSQVSKKLTSDLVYRATSFTYDDAGRLQMTVNPQGGKSYLFYDAQGRISYRVNAAGEVTGYTYENDRIKTEKRYYDTVLSEDWFVSGSNVPDVPDLSESSSKDRVTTYTYDDAGRLKSTKNGESVVTINGYDGANRLTTVTVGDVVTHYFYDKAGRQTGVLDGENYLTKSFYDMAGRLVKTIRYAEAATEIDDSALNEEGALINRFYYDDKGSLIGTINEKGFVTHTLFNTASDIQETYTYLNSVIDQNITDATTLDQVIALAGDYQLTRSYTDAHGRITSSIRLVNTSGAIVDVNEYDAAGRLTKTTLAYGTDEARSTYMRYNAMGEVIGTITPTESVSSSLGSSPSDTALKSAIETHGVRNNYDYTGRLVSTLDGNNNGNYYYYDKQGRMTYTVNTEGNAVETQYNSFGEALSVTAINASFANFQTGGDDSGIAAAAELAKNYDEDTSSVTVYNEAGQISYRYGDGITTTSFSYNNRGLLVGTYEVISSTQSRFTAYNYDNRGLQTSMESEGISSSTQYDAFGRTIFTTNGAGEITRTQYHDGGRGITVYNGYANYAVTEAPNQNQYVRKSSITYDVFSRVRTQTDGLGNITEYRYDDENRSTTVITPEGISINTYYNRNGDVLKEVDGKNITAKQYFYTQDGKLDYVLDANNQKIVDHDYTDSGLLYESRNADNVITRYEYDAANRIEIRIDDHGGDSETITRYEYDMQGRQVKMHEAFGTAYQRTTEYVYENGRLHQEIRDPDNLALTTTYGYDRSGNMVRVAKGTASTELQITEYEFDDLGRRITEIMDPDGLALTTQYRYDDAGRVSRKIDANNHSTWFVYNKVGEVIQEIDGAGGVKENTYDENGRLTHTISYLNTINTSSLGDTPEAISVADSAHDRHNYFVYDDNGRQRFTLSRVHMDLGQAAVSTSDDARYWIISETTYDNNGNVSKSIRYNNYISDSRVNNLLDSGITLAEAQDIRSSTSSNKITSFTYDALNRLTGTRDDKGYRESYTYDVLGNKISYTNKRNHVWLYEYDSLGRMTDEISPAVYINSGTTFGNHSIVSKTTYDALGNITARTEGLLFDGTQANYNSNSVLDDTQARTTRFEYDTVGRQTKTTHAGFFHEENGNFTGTEISGSFQRTVEVTYDAVGNAVRNRIRVGENEYVDQYKTYDAIGRVIHDIDALGYVTTNSYENGELSAVTRSAIAVSGSPNMGSGASAYWTADGVSVTTSYNDRTMIFEYDALGRKTSTRESNSFYAASYNGSSFSNFTGTAETQFEYDAFGQLTKERQKITNSEWAETLHFYDALGRETLTVDALGYATETAYDAGGNVKYTHEYSAQAEFSDAETDLRSTLTASDDDRINIYSYDALDRLVGQYRTGHLTYERDGVFYDGSEKTTVRVLENQYDAEGNLTKTRNAFGEDSTTQMTYDALGRLTHLTEPKMEDIVNYMGLTGDQFDHVSNKNAQNVYQYDAFGNNTFQVRYMPSAVNGLYAVTRTFDFLGNLLEETDGVNNISYIEGSDEVKVNGVVTEARVETKHGSIAGAKGYHYNSAGRIVAEFEYARNDPNSRLAEKRYAYDKTGRQIGTVNVTDKGYAATANQYNAFGEVTYTTRLDLNTESDWNAFASSGGTANNSGTRVSYTGYDRGGRITVTRDSQGWSTYSYDMAGRVVRHTGQGGTTYNQYDNLGRIVVQALPSVSGNSPKKWQEYDRWGNLISTSHGTSNSGATTYTYDHENRMLTKRLPTVTDAVNNAGQAYASNLTHHMRYDLLGNLVYESDLEGSTLLRSKTMTYDRTGQFLMSETDYRGNRSEYLYDSMGNRSATRNAQGTVYLDRYDLKGNKIDRAILRTDPRLNLGDAFTSGGEGSVSAHAVKTLLNTYRYDVQGRLLEERTFVSTTDKGQSSYDRAVKKYYQYDSLGNISKTINESGIEESFYFDKWGRKAFQYNAEGHLSIWSYYTGNYETDRIKTYRDAGNTTTTYDYNSFGQLEEENISTEEGTRQRLYTYHDNGQLETKEDRYLYGDRGDEYAQHYNQVGAANADPASDEVENYHYHSIKTTYEYDARGNRTEERTVQVKEINKGYDWVQLDEDLNQTDIYAFERQSVTTTSTQRFSYDILDRLKTVSDNNFGETLTTANSDNTLLKKVYSVGEGRLDTLTYHYDGLGNRRNVEANYREGYWGANLQTSDLWYEYDADGNMIVADGVLSDNNKIVIGDSGTRMTYDELGRRKTARWNAGGFNIRLSPTSEPLPVNGYDTITDEIYHYNDLGQLAERESRNSLARDSNNGELADVYVTMDFQTVEERTYNLKGEMTKQVYKNDDGTQSEVRTSYLADGRLSRQDGDDYHVIYADDYYEGDYTNAYDGYDSAGNLKEYRYIADGVGTYTYTYEHDFINGQYQQTSIGVSTNTGNYRPGDTTFLYDKLGNLEQTKVTTVDSGKYDVNRYSYNVDGQVINKRFYKNEQYYNQSATSEQTYRYFNGSQVATFGSHSQNQFSSGYTPISPQYPAASPSNYVISQGDSLLSIAQTVYGDSALWYLIADANNIDVGPSDVMTGEHVGRSLTIPNAVSNIQNNASTFKPYNPGGIVGDVTPSPVFVPPPEQQCDVLKTLIIVVVAVVVTIYTAGLASGAGFSGAWSAGGTILGGGTASGVGLGAATVSGKALAVGAAFAGGVAGSVASQAVAKELGVTESFSLRQAVSSGLVTAATMGIGHVLQGSGEVVKAINKYEAISYAARGAAGYLASNASNIIAGVENHFSWRGLAAQAVGTSAGSNLSASIFGNTDNFFTRVARSFVNGAAVGKLNKQWNRGGQVDYVQIAIDAFGNELGNSIGDALNSAPSDTTPQQVVQEDRTGADTSATDRFNDVVSSAFEESLSRQANLRENGGTVSIQNTNGDYEEVIVTGRRQREFEERAQVRLSSLIGAERNGAQRVINFVSSVIDQRASFWTREAALDNYRYYNDQRARIEFDSLNRDTYQRFDDNRITDDDIAYATGMQSWQDFINLSTGIATAPLALYGAGVVGSLAGRGLIAGGRAIAGEFALARSFASFGQYAGFRAGAAAELVIGAADFASAGALGGTAVTLSTETSAILGAGVALAGAAAKFGDDIARNATGLLSYADNIFVPDRVYGGAAFKNGIHIHGEIPRSNLEIHGVHFARTPDGAKGVLERIGFERDLLDDYDFIPVDIGSPEYARRVRELGGDFDATYGHGIDPNRAITYDNNILNPKSGKIPVWVRSDVFESDERIAQVLSHEIYEVEEVSALAYRPISYKQYIDHVRPNSPDNLHFDAVNEGDRRLLELRALLNNN